MKVAKGTEMLEIAAVVMGKQNTICPTLLWDENTVVLVDTGFPGQLPLLREAIENAGVPFERLNKIILTHQDIDHIGNLPAMVSGSAKKIDVLSGEAEKAYIQGEKKLVKMNPETMKKMMDSMPGGYSEERRKAFIAVMENPPKARVDKTLIDGENLPYCGGIIVISTPGHTPGHICLYHRPSKTLVAGDALRVLDGTLVGPAPQNALDIDLAIKSVKKLTRYDIETIICYHGGLLKGDVKKSLAEIVH
jgi:glyoxylase-like metal-dependent hydrolase (beta-lactamase superfamily II)